MKSRRKSREAALQALYQCDALDDWSDESVQVYFEVFQECVEPLSPIDSDNYSFAAGLANGVVRSLEFIDHQLTLASAHWSLGRMSRVDRNILRLACYEIFFVSEIPASVSINEAVELAKRYSTEESPMFINGVLDNVAKAAHAQPNLGVDSLRDDDLLIKRKIAV